MCCCGPRTRKWEEFLHDDNVFINIKSFHLAFDEIMKALEDDSVSTVAVWGMAGVGKTTLVEEVEKRAREKKAFDRVIKASASSSPVLEMIQYKIAEFLEIDFKYTGIRKAEQLRLRLKEENRILIILEDVWDGLNLKAIGIPYGEDQKGCKILVTTRCEQVCISMRIQKVIRLDILSDDEACDLLKMKAIDLTDRDSQINVAVKIAKECQGLPVAIVELGRRLRGKSLVSWVSTYRELRSSSFMEGEFAALTNTKLRLGQSYSQLRKRTTKLCFLLCSFFPQDYTIDVEVLTRYAWGLGLFEGFDSIKKVRCEVWAAIENLISSSLLLDHGETTVKMHNLVRRWALERAKSEDIFSFRIVPKIGLDKWPTVRDIGERSVGEALEILSLDGGGSIISSALMGRMKSLKVFTLYDGHLSACALEDLANLRTLCLVRCQVADISSLGMLQKLEVLSFRGSDISELPHELGGLNYLRLLDLVDCQKLQNIPLKLIRKLSQLEELYFNCRSFEEWWFEETSTEGSKARLFEPSEIISSCSLPSNLQTFEIAIKEDGTFHDHHNPTSRLDSFKDLLPTVECLHVNHSIKEQPAVGQSAKELKVEDCYKPQLVFHDDELRYINEEDNPTLILSKSTRLELIELPQLTCAWNRPTDHLPIRSLKVVKIKDCHKLTSLFSFSLDERMVRLEKLEIAGCHALKQIMNDSSLYLPTLITLEIADCGSLEYVFRITTASFAPQLRVLNISDCPRLDQVIQVGSADIELPQLQRLAVKRLKCLTTFLSGEFSVGLPCLEELEVEACPQLMTICKLITRPELKDLCLSKMGNRFCEEIIQLQDGYLLSSMEKLLLTEINELEVIWKDPSQILTLQNLSQLKVYKCSKLKKIFTLQLARNLPQLSHLEVQECEELEQIVALDGISSSSQAARHKPEYFPKLEEICIMECNKLRSLFPVSVSRLPKLKKLKVKGASNMREMFGHDSKANMTKDEKMKEISLPKLEVLILEGLPKLLCFAPLGYYFVFPALISLRVKECPCSKIMRFNFNDDWKDRYVRAEIEKSLLPREYILGSSMQNIKVNNDENILWDYPGTKLDDLGF